ncbi:uncharacterized protein LOC112343390 [Selaginella moellendorffii]|uniref:uncharacterized protein LOC112343390 n=1 Tax=Selaginella moellendorffii TaxID=88036 RepID=UPI000D1C7F4A|nr:uncharacterized protein LOC112343390 [Selaginella moellendorffii]|eukprot:XP_024522522.1 uncharacterized protein LOC112343390 [Selaginella moellendorffii]
MRGREGDGAPTRSPRPPGRTVLVLDLPGAGADGWRHRCAPRRDRRKRFRSRSRHFRRRAPQILRLGAGIAPEALSNLASLESILERNAMFIMRVGTRLSLWETGRRGCNGS